MKICHVIDYFHTDVGYQEFYLALEQALAGHEVHVVCSTHRQHTVATPGADEEAGAQRLRSAGVTVHRLDARQLGHDRAWLKGLGSLLKSVRPDALHVHGAFSPTTVRAVMAGSGAGCGILVDSHLSDQNAPAAASQRNRAIYGAYRRTVGVMLRRRVAAWVVNGPWERQFLARELGLDPEEIRLVSLGFDTKDFGWNAERRSHARARLGIATTTPLVVMTGKLYPAKGPHLAAAAFERVLGSAPGKVIFAATFADSSQEDVEREMPTLIREGKVEFVGLLDREHLIDLYHAADAVIFPLLPSISVLEAAGSGSRVLVGPNEFGNWISGLCDVIQTRAMKELSISDIMPMTDAERGVRARAAAAAVGWRDIAAEFVDLYCSTVAAAER